MARRSALLRLGLLVAMLALCCPAMAVAAQGGEDPPAHYYVVQPGDSIAKVARKCALSFFALLEANRDLENPNHIVPGQRLRLNAPCALPAPGQEAQAVSTAATVAPAGAEGGGTYVVRPGDTLAAIAARHGVLLAQLLELNRIADPNRIYAGQVLRLPEGAREQPAGVSAAEAPEIPPVGKFIAVSLAEQRVRAYEDGQLLQEFTVSTGLPTTPTVAGRFAIYAKVPKQRMRGPDYDLPNVPWVLYFYRGYSFHGTYWHNSFGRPMSHGCVNMRIEDAQWLYEWAEIGTPVLVY